jgi:hypothetical protein
MAPAPPEPRPAAPALHVPRKVSDNGDALPGNREMERLAHKDPVAFLKNCIRRYQRDVQGYHLIMQKQERLGGRLQPTEVIDVWFREKPFSVLLKWLHGAGRAEKALYVEGQNGDQTLVRPAGALARKIAGDVLRIDPTSAEARQSGRYSIKEFGLNKGALRTLASWEDAAKEDALHVEFLGVIQVKEAGDRPCWALRRTRYARPENDGVTELTVYYDTETWLQVGSVLKGEEGKVIGSYFFRDIQLNPTFKPKQFDRSALES